MNSDKWFYVKMFLLMVAWGLGMLSIFLFLPQFFA